MVNKKKRVDVVSVQIESALGAAEVPSFQDLIAALNGTEVSHEGKLYELKLLNTNVADCIVGIVETTQDKDIPPIKNKQTKVFSQVPIDTEREGLAYANIFLLDFSLNVFIYEVNRNGCYLHTLKDLLESKWNELHEENKIQIVFAAVCRLDEYRRMLGMNYYRKFICQICCPSEVLHAVRLQEQSLAKCLLESQLEAAVQNNVDSITVEQKCSPIHLNREGMQAGFVRDLAGMINALCGIGQRSNIKNFIIHGYTLDPESLKQRSTTINMLADVFEEYISIPEVQVQSSLQVLDRKASIETLYGRIVNELRQIIHRA